MKFNLIFLYNIFIKYIWIYILLNNFIIFLLRIYNIFLLIFPSIIFSFSFNRKIIKTYYEKTNINCGYIVNL